MAHGLNPCASHVLADREIGGAFVSMVEYQWDEDDFIFSESLDNIHYRLAPHRIALSASMDGRPGVRIGQMIAVPGGSELSLSSHNARDSARTIVCKFTGDWLYRLAGATVDLRNFDASRTLNVASPNARNSFQRIAVEMTAPGFASDAFIEAILQTAVIEMIRDFRGIEHAPSPAGRLSAVQLARVVAMIRQSGESSPRASELADDIGVSVSHFRRLFKAATGQTVHEYVMQDRLERSKTLLSDRSLSLKSIAYQLGFSCPSAFTIAFRRAAGCSPTEFRRARLL